MSGKGAKGLIMGKSASNKDKDKKKPVSRSSRAGLQVSLSLSLINFTFQFFLFLSSFAFWNLERLAFGLWENIFLRELTRLKKKKKSKHLGIIYFMFLEGKKKWQFVVAVEQKLIIEVNYKLVEKNLCFLGCEKNLGDQAVSTPFFFFFFFCILF